MSTPDPQRRRDAIRERPPTIGITLGDPAGIGPEILARLLDDRVELGSCVPVVIGDAQILREAQALVGATARLAVVAELPAEPRPGQPYVLDLANVALDELVPGRVSESAGRAAGQYIERGVELALARRIDALVTNPINKEAFSLAGYGQRYAGHTEMLAALTGAKSVCMMLASGELRVCHVTTHVSLLEALQRHITRARVLQVIRLARDACTLLELSRPLIGVAAVNPHASEGGLFGDEERREIIPAIEDAQREGISVEGPVPADTLFSKAAGGMYAVAVAMYHDQGHIPVKLQGFHYEAQTDQWEMSGTNVTLGLPIIRTSVDHGTAFDRAWKGTSSPRSLREALRMAVQLARGARADGGS